jgi:hypothetical protein
MDPASARNSITGFMPSGDLELRCRGQTSISRRANFGVSVTGVKIEGATVDVCYLTRSWSSLAGSAPVYQVAG